LNGQSLGKRYVDIKPASGSQAAPVAKNNAENMPADCVTIFVKNLPYEFAEDDIGDRFRQFGEIASVRIAYNW
jgi:RNA recognition motif-containing protein